MVRVDLFSCGGFGAFKDGINKLAALKACAVDRLIFPSTRQMALVTFCTDTHGMLFILSEVKSMLLKRVRLAEPVSGILFD